MEDEPASKRLRQEDEESIDEMVLDDSGEEESGEEDEEAVFERARRRSCAAASSSRKKEVTAGIIEEIYCEHFMCHKKMVVKPCRRVNFVTGANGSGKSAILAALQICLGASAKATHRGNRIGDLVREGHEGQAVVRVTLLNEGEDGVKQEKYGDKIGIERRFGRTSAATLCLLDESGKVVSRDRKELRAILDALKITVDNPVCVLDQENSKNFIRGKSKEKYAFFLKATEIKGVLSLIKRTNDNAKIMLFDAEKQKAKLAHYAEAYEEAKHEYDEITKLQKYDDEIRELKFAGAWITVAAAEASETIAKNMHREKKTECDEAAADLEKAEEDYRERYDRDRDGEGGGEEDLTRLKRELDACLESSQEAMAAIRAQNAEIRTKTADLEASKRAADSAKKDRDGTKRQLDTIRRENANKRAASNAAKTAEDISKLEHEIQDAERNLEKARIEHDEAEKASADIPRQKTAKKNAASDAKYAADQLKADVASAQYHVKELETAAKDAASSSKGGKSGSSTAFGAVPRGLDRVRFSSPPVGPVGAFVEFNCSPEDRRKWSVAVDSTIGNLLKSWIVSSHADKNALFRLDRSLNIIVQPPSPRYQIRKARGQLAVADLLSVDDDRVFNALVDQCSIDVTCLYDSKADAERRGMSFDKGTARQLDGVQRLLLPNGDETGERGGNLYYRAKAPSRRGANTLRVTLLGNAGGGLEDAAERYLASLDDARKVLDQCTDLYDEAKRAHSEAQREAKQVASMEASAQRECDRALRKLRSAERGVVDLRRSLAKLEQDDEDTRDSGVRDTAPLEAELADNEQALLAAEEERRQANGLLEAEREKLIPLQATKSQHDARNKAIEADMSEATRRLEALVEEQRTAHREKEKLRKHVEKLKHALGIAENAAEEERKRVEGFVEKAEVFCKKILGEAYEGRPEQRKHLVVRGKSYKTAQQVKGRIDALQDAKAKALRRRNVSEVDPNIAKQKVDRAKAAYNEKMAGCKQIEAEGNDLKRDAHSRWNRLKKIRAHICRRSNTNFDTILNNKGASGALLFDHKQQLLTLCYQKDSADASTQIDNVTSLSGGERSFSTLAMLLALGATIECPFRVMDEFDVFMDQVSRKIAMRELIDMANQNSNRQFIFITPQDLSSLQPSNVLKIFKLNPPIRGQQTLADAFANNNNNNN